MTTFSFLVYIVNQSMVATMIDDMLHVFVHAFCRASAMTLLNQENSIRGAIAAMQLTLPSGTVRKGSPFIC
jgi:hypothetical protein